MTEPKTLNQGQEACAQAFFSFLFTEDPAFIISGPGGVGKTFLMSHLIDSIMPQYMNTCDLMGIDREFDEVQMTATTNKAAEVLAVGTCRPTSTIQSYMNLKVEDDYKTGQSKLTPTKQWRVHQRKIIFIDECSMVDSHLMKYLGEGTHKSKIVFVGDHCQLAPVMETISPIYKATGVPFYELTEQMRNAEQPALMNLCNQLRQSVETGEFKPIQIVPGVIDHLNDDQLQEKLEEHFTTQTMNSRILAYTNNRVLAYNDHIRGIRKLPDEFQVGEYLVNNSAVHLPGRMLSVEEEVTIISQGPKEKVYFDDDAELEIRRCTIETRIGDQFSGIPIPVDRHHYMALVKYYGKKKDWHNYFKLKNFYPDLRQRDAATVHKSQGSTYDTVFIDLADISRCTHSDQAARLLYVAVSRPRTQIYLYGNLADKYGGLTY